MRRNVKGSFDEKKTGTLTKPFIDFFLVFVQNKMDPLSLSLICIKWDREMEFQLKFFKNIERLSYFGTWVQLFKALG